MAFVLPRRLGANPQLYDYVHGLCFSEDGAVEMVDAAGQEIISIARGRFTVETINESDAILYLSDLVEVDPHKQDEKIRDLEWCQIDVTAEAGVFVFQRPIGPSHAEAQWPFHVYRNRYVFNVDPFAYARDKEMQNAYYHLVMTQALMESARHYYPVGSENKATAADVRALGIAPAGL
jgi:hypothetical protein